MRFLWFQRRLQNVPANTTLQNKNGTPHPYPWAQKEHLIDEDNHTNKKSYLCQPYKTDNFRLRMFEPRHAPRLPLPPQWPAPFHGPQRPPPPLTVAHAPNITFRCEVCVLWCSQLGNPYARLKPICFPHWSRHVVGSFIILGITFETGWNNKYWSPHKIENWENCE